MTLEAVFSDLSAQWKRMVEEGEHGLLWAVTETKPDEEHALATHYVDAATDLVAIAREGLAACPPSAAATPNLAQAGKGLLRCQEQYNALVSLYYSRLASYSRLRRLKRFGREKTAWRDWATHVRKALDLCRGSMDDLNRALFCGWQELTDRVGLGGVSVHATNIGQQITVPKTEAELESVT
jgi:hypothetical protein